MNISNLKQAKPLFLLIAALLLNPPAQRDVRHIGVALLEMLFRIYI